MEDLHDQQRQVADTPSPRAPATVAPEQESWHVGQITGLVDCRWATWKASSGQWTVGSKSDFPNPKSQIPNLNLVVPLGTKYDVTSGLLEITYDTGAKVILQGPCKYEIESAASGFLSLGKLTARVERRAEGEAGSRRGEVDSAQWAVGSESKIKSQNPNFSLRPPPSAFRPPSRVVGRANRQPLLFFAKAGRTNHFARPSPLVQ